MPRSLNTEQWNCPRAIALSQGAGCPTDKSYGRWFEGAPCLQRSARPKRSTCRPRQKRQDGQTPFRARAARYPGNAQLKVSCRRCMVRSTVRPASLPVSYGTCIVRQTEMAFSFNRHVLWLMMPIVGLNLPVGIVDYRWTHGPSPSIVAPANLGAITPISARTLSFRC